MSNHQNIEDLFRSKLEEAEITPSKGAWKGVQRKLRMKQFLRFDGKSFNIWYAGALLVVGTASLLTLNLNSSESQREEVQDIPVIEEVQEAITETTSRNELREEKREEKRVEKRGNKKSTDAATKREEGKRRERVDKKAERLEQAKGREQAAEMKEEPLPVESGSSETDTLIPSQRLFTHFTASATEGCEPLRVEFRNSSVYASEISWDFGNGELSDESDPVYLFEKAGIYAVALNAIGVEGEEGVFYQVIRVYPSPVAGFKKGEEIQEPDGAISLELMNYSTGAFSYNWDLLSSRDIPKDGWSSNEFQPTLNNKEIPEGASQIRLVVMNEHGCTDTSSSELGYLGAAEKKLTFPTVFSGNSTGPTGGYYNPNERRLDVFYPHYSEEPAEYHLRIYSKMGEVIFETQDLLQGWDGYYRQEATPSGVYIWVATGTWQNGTTFNLRGDVTLLWNNR